MRRAAALQLRSEAGTAAAGEGLEETSKCKDPEAEKSLVEAF